MKMFRLNDTFYRVLIVLAISAFISLIIIVTAVNKVQKHHASAISATEQTKYWKTGPYSEWFKNLENAQKQSCCGEADGYPYDGNYTVHSDGSVTLHLGLADGGDLLIPTGQVITRANPTGHAIWFRSRDGRTYCFVLGPLA